MRGLFTFVGNWNFSPRTFNNPPLTVSVNRMLKSTTLERLMLPIGAFGIAAIPNSNSKMSPGLITTPAKRVLETGVNFCIDHAPLGQQNVIAGTAPP